MRFRPEIVIAAAARQIDPDLVQAIVWQESGGDPWAYNPEERYRYFWDVRAKRPFRSVTVVELGSLYPPQDFPALKGDRDQEWWAQRASWGLMQIMGAVAREHGFAGPYLPELCDPALNLHLGCAHLADLLTWAGGQVSQAVAAYNTGRGNWTSVHGATYATAVQARLDAIRARHA